LKNHAFRVSAADQGIIQVTEAILIN